MKAFLIVLPIFLLIAMGWVLKYKRVLSSETLKENNFLLYWLAMPATLLQGILRADMEVLQNPLFLLAVWAPYVFTLVIVWTTGRYHETPARFAALTLSAVRGNHFFAGIPIVYLAMGPRGVEAGTLILAFSLVIMQLLSIGSGQLALFGQLSWKSIRATGLQLLKNPLFMTCFFGLILVFIGLNHLPTWANETLEILGDISTGLALLMLGAELHLENIFKMLLSVWKIVLFKLVVHPIVTYLVFTGLGLSGEMIQAGVLLAAMPVGVNTSIVAQAMGMDNEYCSRGVAITTLCSVLSLPLWIGLLGLA
ncbi:MAG: AEC family transporter [Synergistaceae bacterium]|jgi:predicted permease|nr:AEC family transporter [Synergistaceae bacterium]